MDFIHIQFRRLPDAGSPFPLAPPISLLGVSNAPASKAVTKKGISSVHSPVTREGNPSLVLSPARLTDVGAHTNERNLFVYVSTFLLFSLLC